MATMDELRAGVRKSSLSSTATWSSGGRWWRRGHSRCPRRSSLASRSSVDRAAQRVPAMKKGTQTEHLRGVAGMAMAMAEQVEAVVGPLGIDRDLLIACALCHDLGKPFEYSPRNQARWKANPAISGYPAVRHPAYGAYVALTVGLPEAVVHTAGAHSAEGERIQRSLENTIVAAADHTFWLTLRRASTND